MAAAGILLPISSFLISRVAALANAGESSRILFVKTERPPGNQAAFLSRENSSNGGSIKPIRTFWQKSYVSLKASVKEFFQNKCLCFQ